MKKYVICAITILLLAGCNQQDELQKLRNENQELQNRLSALEQENTKLKEQPTTSVSVGQDDTGSVLPESVVRLRNTTPLSERQANGASTREVSRDQKLQACQSEAEKKFVGKTSIMNDYRGRPVEVVQETETLKCEYNDLYTSGRVFKKDNGSRENLAWSQNSDDVICPETVKKYGSICK